LGIGFSGAGIVRFCGRLKFVRIKRRKISTGILLTAIAAIKGRS
jgi:hypothetical protein